jgi:hypothetical protein
MRAQTEVSKYHGSVSNKKAGLLAKKLISGREQEMHKVKLNPVIPALLGRFQV